MTHQPSLLDHLPTTTGQTYTAHGFGYRKEGGSSYTYEFTWPRHPGHDDPELITYLTDRFLNEHARYDQLDQLEIRSIRPTGATQ